jgi:hypothetical protein
MSDQGDGQRRLNLQMPNDLAGGVWANFAVVSHSEYEFTIDFARVDFAHAGEETNGIVTSRVNLSPLLVSQLLDALQDNWNKYAAKALPKEVQGEG